MDTTINVFTIDPATRTISYGPIPRGVDGLYRTLGCDLVDVISLRPGVDLWVDDEGRLSYPNPSGYFKIAGEIVCGRGVVAGCDDMGNTTSVRAADVPVTFLALTRAIEWIDTPAADAVEPGFTLTAIGGDA